MKTNDIRRIIDTGLANVTTTPQDVDAVMNHILSGSARKKAPVRKARVVIAALAAVMITLLLSVIGYGLGVPVWDVFVRVTEDNIEFRVGYTDKHTVLLKDEKEGLSREEISAWGENVSNALDAIGIYPDMPQYVPEGFRETDLTYNVESLFIRVILEDDQDHYLDYSALLFPADSEPAIGSSISHDGRYYEEFMVDGITYTIVSNTDEYHASWYDRHGMYTLAGNVEPEVLKDMIRSIVRKSEPRQENIMINGFTSGEIAAWGEDACILFAEIGIYPDLPSYVPEGFVLTDSNSYSQVNGYSYVNLLYENADGKKIRFVLHIYHQAGDYNYSLSAEFDYREYRSFNLQGVDYVIGSNLSVNSAAWFDKKGCYMISGDLSIDELEKMVRSIERDFDSVITPDDLKSGANE